MRRNTFFVVLIVLILFVFYIVKVSANPAKETNTKKFEVVFNVKYNAITLEEAARKEGAFRETYKDACEVDVKVSEVSFTPTQGYDIGSINSF